MKWISVNHNCPVCRSPIKKTHYCRVMDDFITSLCNLLGGSTKFQRDDIIRERTLSSGISFLLTINLIINVNLLITC